MRFEILDTKDAVILFSPMSLVFCKYFDSASPKNTILIIFEAITFELKATISAVAANNCYCIFHIVRLCVSLFDCVSNEHSGHGTNGIVGESKVHGICLKKINQKDSQSSYLDILIKPSNENPF